LRFASGASASASALPPFPLQAGEDWAGEASGGAGLTPSAKLTQLPPSTLPVFLDPATGRFRAALGDGGLAQARSQGDGRLGDDDDAGYDPVFGPRAAKGVSKDDALTYDALGKLAFSGAVCASAAHFALTPIELTKTRMQLLSQARAAAAGAALADPRDASSSPSSSQAPGDVSAAAVALPPPPNPVETLRAIYRDEGGLKGLYQGADSSAVGYFVAGAVGFALTELFRRQLVAGAGGLGGLAALGLDPSAATVGAALGAGVLATVAVAPFEKARVALQKKRSSGEGGGGGGDGGSSTAGRRGLASALAALLRDERGWVSGLFDGVPLLLAKDIVFAVVKFQAFDVAKALLFAAVDPGLRQGLAGSLFVSLAAGAAAGVLSALASQPGDTVFTKLASVSSAKRRGIDQTSFELPGGAAAAAGVETAAARGGGGSLSGSPSGPGRPYGPVDALQDVWAQQGVAGLYAGAAPRAFFAGSLLALEFLIYDGLRAFFHVTSGDLTVALDVLAPLVAPLTSP
jgi:hypothetical protein